MNLMKILLIDDHVLFRDGILLMLEGLNLPVETLEASSYESAKIIMDETSDISLVLLDLDLPGISFFDALKAIRKQLPDTPIVILSGTVDHQIVEQTLRLGARGYLPKSATAKTMLNALQLVLSGDTYVPTAILQNKITDSITITKTQRKNESLEHNLTPRQYDVLIQLVEGKSNKAIAKALYLTESTVRAHVAAILRSFDVNNRTQAVRYAVQKSWVTVKDSS
ncbi:DNA-binding response regulator, LuxR family [hydrothermal vent metagenome]|uniref:DNA-binding response regulator, LuxR family n=1 Tax=hydrothermal vent metagenome TaxID=652676 RepID=A0A3B0WNG1_9ZZZZ